MNDVVFRRIRGRIIPIKMSKQQKEKVKEGAQGIAIAGAGVGTSIVAGKGFKTFANKAFRVSIAAKSIAQRSSTPTDLFQYAASQNKLPGYLRAARNYAKTARAFKSVGILGGALLAGLGVARFANSLSDKKNPTRDAIAGGLGATAVFKGKQIAEYFFTTSAAGHSRQAIKTFIKDMAPKLKGLIKARF